MLFRDDLKVIPGGKKINNNEIKVSIDTNKLDKESQRYKLYEIIRDLLWYRGRLATTDLDYMLGFPIGTIKSWAIVKAPKSRLSKVAEHFGVTIHDLYTAEDFRDLL